MQFTNIHQMIGYRGVVFDVLEFEVMRRSQFGALYFDVARQVNDRIIERVIKVYDRMQARERPCLLKVSISKPLNRDQCDALNAQRWTLTSLIPAQPDVSGPLWQPKSMSPLLSLNDCGTITWETD